MRLPVLVLGLLAVSVCSVPACGASDDSSPTLIPASRATSTPILPVTFRRADAVYPGGVLHLEVASTEAQEERGLSYRDSLATDAGMIFDLGSPRVQQIWMKGMRFPLDLLWIDADKRVAEITAGVQPQPGADDSQLTRYAPARPVRWVLELNAGAAARLGIGTGAQLAFDLAR